MIGANLCLCIKAFHAVCDGKGRLLAPCSMVGVNRLHKQECFGDFFT